MSNNTKVLSELIIHKISSTQTDLRENKIVNAYEKLSSIKKDFYTLINELEKEEQMNISKNSLLEPRKKRLEFEERDCSYCILDGTDACPRGAGRAVNDTACESFLTIKGGKK